MKGTKTVLREFIQLVLIFIICCSNIFAQNNASIKGKILDSSTKEALPGASITVVGTGLGGATDIYGNYFLKNVPVGAPTIRVSYIGYKTYEQKVQTHANKITEITINLIPESLTGEEIVITAQAKGQTEAINQQLTSNTIVNIVSSARIQELPDDNAAESVGRLPGISIQRSGGEGNKIVIRGLAPKYNNIQVAGVKMSSTDSDDRSVDLSMISPYMLEGIEVSKAITPDMDADALGGTVNFKLKEAQKGLKYDLLLQGGYSDLKNTYNDYKIVGNGSNRFLDDDLGIFAQFDVERRNRNSNSMSAGYYLNSPVIDKVNKVYINSLGLKDIVRSRNRYGGTLVLDYKLPMGSIILNNFFSYSKTPAQTRSESYDINDISHSYSIIDDETDLSVLVNSLKYVQDFPILKVEAELSHSYSENKSPDSESFSFVEGQAIKNADRTTSPNDLPKYAVNNLSTTYLQDISQSNSKSKDREIAGTLNLSKNVSLTNDIISIFKIGGKLNYKDRNYDYNVGGGFLNSGSGQVARDAILNAYPWMKQTVSTGSMNMPYTLFIDDSYTCSDNFLKGRYSLGRSANIDMMKNILQIVKNLGSSEAFHYNDFSSEYYDYSGTEFYKAGFAMADLRYTNMVQVIVGARYEEVKQKYTGVSGDSQIGYASYAYSHKDTTTTVTHSNLLPMVHLKIKPVEWFDIRFAYTNTLSRPDYTTIIPKINLAASSVTWNNYQLKPAHSENFDIYFSFHENKIGLLTVGVFKKKIKDLIFASNGKVLIDPSTIGLSATEKGKTLYTYLNNEYPVDLYGGEVSWQTNFWYLPGILKGLVLDVNYTHIHSEAKYPRAIINNKFIMQPPWILQTEVDTFYTARMLSQPDDILNISLGYDYKGFSIRGSVLYQSNVFTKTNFWPELRENTADYWRWDISVKQELPWDGYQVYMNITNLSGTIDKDINTANGFSSSEQYYGTGVDLGIRYRVK